MSARILRLPSTPAGRDLIRELIRVAGGWDFPDDTRADDYDFDLLAVERVALIAQIDADMAEVEASFPPMTDGAA